MDEFDEELDARIRGVLLGEIGPLLRIAEPADPLARARRLAQVINTVEWVRADWYVNPADGYSELVVRPRWYWQVGEVVWRVVEPVSSLLERLQSPDVGWMRDLARAVDTVDVQGHVIRPTPRSVTRVRVSPAIRRDLMEAAADGPLVPFEAPILAGTTFAGHGGLLLAGLLLEAEVTPTEGGLRVCPTRVVNPTPGPESPGLVWGPEPAQPRWS